MCFNQCLYTSQVGNFNINLAWSNFLTFLTTESTTSSFQCNFNVISDRILYFKQIHICPLLRGLFICCQMNRKVQWLFFKESWNALFNIRVKKHVYNANNVLTLVACSRPSRVGMRVSFGHILGSPAVRDLFSLKAGTEYFRVGEGSADIRLEKS